MNCPIEHEALVRYWTGETAAEETELIETHLFSCDACFAAAGRVAALASGLGKALPPVITGADLDRAKARGVLMGSNDFHPGETKEAWMKRGVDVLIHRLVLHEPELEHASLEFETLAGTPLFAYAEVPVDPSGAILVACQRHFTALVSEPDMRIRVRGTSAKGETVSVAYTVLHRFE